MFFSRIRMLPSVTVSGNKRPASPCMTIVGICHGNTLVAHLASSEACLWLQSTCHSDVSWASATSVIEVNRRSYLHVYACLVHEI